MASTSPTPEKEASVSNSIADSIAFAKIIAKNSLSLPWIARDLNVARQNLIKIVKIKGGDATNKADAMFLKSSEADAKLAVEQQKLTAKAVTPTKEVEEKKGAGGFLGKMLGKTKLGQKLLNNKIIKAFMGIFSPAGFMRILGRLALPLMIFSAVWEGITGAWETWQQTGSIWETFKSFAGGIVDFFTFGLIDKQMVSDFYDWSFGAIEKVSKSIADFFGFGEWFTEKFAKVKEFLGVGVTAKKAEPKKEQPEEEQPAVKQKEPKAADIEKKRKEKQAEEEKKQAQQGTVLTTSEGTPVVSGGGEPVTTAPTPAPEPAPAPAPTPTPEPKKEEKAAKPAKAPSPGFQAGKQVMVAALDKEGISNPDARAQIMAQAAHESGSFRYTEELGGPSYFEKYNGRKDLGNTQPGDGPRFKGRGFLQTTGRTNYEQFKQAFGVDVVEKPDVLAQAKYAAESALFWFKKNAKKVEKLSNGNWADTRGVTKAVNGGFNGLEDRMQYFEKFRNDPTITKVGSATTAPEGSQVASTSSAVAADQRQQTKPKTPIVVNAPTTNTTTTTVNRTTVAQGKDNNSTNSALMARAT